MRYYSTNDHNKRVCFEDALFNALPSDGGLYLPEHIPELDKKFWNSISKKSFNDIALEMGHALIGDEIPMDELAKLIDKAFDFDAPLKTLNDGLHVLELFHGPSLAFKDFGARFMAATMSWFLEKRSRSKITILVATSGDTGGAVAKGFLNVENIDVVILYPKGKVSELQEQQLTTNGNNIKALEVHGSFDDCQRMVKEAFLDKNLNSKRTLTSANSINIARLIPQTFYYASAYGQVKERGDKVVFSVPSGNLGNLTAGILAWKMGLPAEYVVAATNANCVVPEYLLKGDYRPRQAITTISNAMDVGDPSNFPRLVELFEGQHDLLSKMIKGAAFTNNQTLAGIEELYKDYQYIVCPHSAIAYLGLKKHLHSRSSSTGIFLSTAHPAKFLDVMDKEIASKVEMPDALSQSMKKKKESTKVRSEYQDLKDFLMQC